MHTHTSHPSHSRGIRRPCRGAAFGVARVPLWPVHVVAHWARPRPGRVPAHTSVAHAAHTSHAHLTHRPSAQARTWQTTGLLIASSTLGPVDVTTPQTRPRTFWVRVPSGGCVRVLSGHVAALSVAGRTQGPIDVAATLADPAAFRVCLRLLASLLIQFICGSLCHHNSQ
jgi:hypothetical protein